MVLVAAIFPSWELAIAFKSVKNDSNKIFVGDSISHSPIKQLTISN
jgi:hypothetical protein